MNNFKATGNSVEFTAPTGGVTAGLLYFIGNLAVVASVTALVGVKFVGVIAGIFSLVKTTGTAWTEGQPLYWDIAGAKASTDPSAGPYVGTSTAIAVSGAAVGNVKLKDQAGGNQAGVLQVRKRFTIAEVIAGDTILAAFAGRKYRMIDCTVIAIGGAAAAVTTVDVLGDLGGSRKLVAFAQAQLTQSTVLRPGITGAAVLADGASFVANDAGDPILIGQTGSDITTATHIDVIFTYALDAET